MSKDIGHAVLCGIVASIVSVSAVAKEQQSAGAGQLKIEVPFEPTPFNSPDGDYSAYELAPPKAGEPMRLQRVDSSNARQRSSQPGGRGTHLAYELMLTNVGSAPLTLQRIEIAGASRRSAQPVVAYEGSELEALLAFPDRQPEADRKLQLKATERVVINLFLSFRGGKSAPTTLSPYWTAFRKMFLGRFRPWNR
jgi:hypothetical protein